MQQQVLLRDGVCRSPIESAEMILNETTNMVAGVKKSPSELSRIIATTASAAEVT
jgi:hypothetical protein